MPTEPGIIGHGVPYLPYPTDAHSHGPDQWHGPPPCRGEAFGCEYGAGVVENDHACCCDPCRHKKMPCEFGCCKCLPRYICATFTPDVVDTDINCKRRAWLIEISDFVTGARANYTQGLPVIGAVDISVGAPDGDSYLYGTDCSWRFQVYSQGVDEETAIDHVGDVHCLAPPEMTISGVNYQYDNGQTVEDCLGTFSFAPFVDHRIPFEYKWEGILDAAGDELITPYSPCGYCTTLPRFLCVRREGATDSSVDDTHTTLLWSPVNQRWQLNDEIITPVVQDGQCHFELTSIDSPASLEGDLIRMDDCELPAVTARDGDDWIKVSANPCECWQYRCGTCRCVPEVLCIVGYDNGALVEPFEVTWDDDEKAWLSSDGYFRVDLTREIETNNCVVVVSGVTTDEPIYIDNACGGDLQFIAHKSLELALYDGDETWYAGFAQRCAPCDFATCLTLCEDVPNVIFADVSPTAWTPMLGCDQYDLCFDPFTIPLASFFDPNTTTAAEYRWFGSAVFACHGCDTGGNPGIEDPVNYRMTIEVGCDGVVTVTIFNETDNCSEEFTIQLPCNTTWNETLTSKSPIDCSVCCSDAGFEVVLTE